MGKNRNSSTATVQNGSEEKIDIEAILRARMADFSPSEQNLAAHMLDNVHMLPFETGSSIAQAVGVSEMTVTRFVRGLGFESLRDLKNRLRHSVAEKDSDIDDYMGRFQVRNTRQQVLQESLRLDLDAIVKAYALTATDLWDEAAVALAKSRTVYVVGFQASKGLAMDFASRLLWARPNVIFVDNTSGTYGEIIAADPKHSLVVLVDTASYATRGIKLAEKLKSLDMPLIVVTDKFSHWAFAYTRFVFEGHTHVKTFWDSTASLGVILNLMIDTVAVRLGPKAKRNFAAMSDLGNLFGEFVGGSYLRRKD
ncbi:MurR/RpiR family transcriptional regulator [Mesorhizobium opportunistum]|uniref:MurR/RpiR family transcriptional regulator n=1 Tax=Mesorhizobium opportunistum TaxID=593909 RepID=A0ABV1YBT1_9HYPH|nr:MurR/RpiR family transcriptional regulator [Mesorhizobium sp.]TIN94325.1 MAG: MurR/RpiR family transcriptional regulator [Mesorhizobium sp.]TJU96081.1 MAG: MurR/RpiR family transcriptional regulator [Mesorhizobium sp.]TJV16327.1 MAG: MurR/RpiR family transcriptional regulator [Mesorhizobium sp.]